MNKRRRKKALYKLFARRPLTWREKKAVSILARNSLSYKVFKAAQKMAAAFNELATKIRAVLLPRLVAAFDEFRKGPA